MTTTETATSVAAFQACMSAFQRWGEKGGAEKTEQYLANGPRNGENAAVWRAREIKIAVQEDMVPAIPLK
jgi:hypothetical protein